MDRVPDGRRKGSLNPRVVVVDSSDSDSEGFVEELRVHSNSKGKASSESLKTGGNASSFSKGEASKGKAYSSDKGGKVSASNTVPTKSDAELKLELDIPPNCRILMNCEGAELLQEIHERMAILSEDPKIKIPESFDRALPNMQKMEIISPLQTLQNKPWTSCWRSITNCGIDDGEICMIANIGPESVEEIYALVPSLKANRSLTEGPITEVLAALANIKAAN